MMRERRSLLVMALIIKRPGFLNKLIRFETFHSALQYFSFALSVYPMGTGRNLSYKKNLFFRK